MDVKQISVNFERKLDTLDGEQVYFLINKYKIVKKVDLWPQKERSALLTILVSAPNRSVHERPGHFELEITSPPKTKCYYFHTYLLHIHISPLHLHTYERLATSHLPISGSKQLI